MDMELFEFAGLVKDEGVLALYLTTGGQDAHTGRITMLELVADGTDAVCIHRGRLPSPELAILKDMLLKCRLLVLHDAQRILAFLLALGIVPEAVFDLTLAAQILHFSVDAKDFDLQAIARRCLGAEWSGDGGSEAKLMLRLCPLLTARLRENGLMEVAEIEFGCLRATAGMEYRGIYLNQEMWLRLEKEMQDQLDTAREKLYEFSGRPIFQLTLWGEEESLNINFSSNAYVLSLLQENGIPVKSTGKRELYPYRDHPLVAALMAYRKYAKLISSFLQPIKGMIHPVTGRLHPHYGQLSAYSGRMSCWNPNIQQIPREHAFRACFTAPPGRLLLIADYSQIELRVAAQISRDQRMLAAYQQGEDLHALTASILTGKPVHQVTKEERQAAKPVNFGLIFGMGPRGLKESAELTYGVEMTLDQAGDFSRRFFAAYQGILQWHSWLKSHPEREGRTLAGRRFYYSPAALLPEVANFPVQGTAADIVKLALGRLARRLDPETMIVAVIHDEILLECPREQAESAARILKETMEAAADQILPLVPASVEVKIAASWAGK